MSAVSMENQKGEYVSFHNFLAASKQRYNLKVCLILRRQEIFKKNTSTEQSLLMIEEQNQVRLTFKSILW